MIYAAGRRDIQDTDRQGTPPLEIIVAAGPQNGCGCRFARAGAIVRDRSSVICSSARSSVREREALPSPTSTACGVRVRVRCVIGDERVRECVWRAHLRTDTAREAAGRVRVRSCEIAHPSFVRAVGRLCGRDADRVRACGSGAQLFGANVRCHTLESAYCMFAPIREIY